VSNFQISDQIDVLNTAYANSGPAFTLLVIDRTVNEEWFNNVNHYGSEQTEMKTELRLGDDGALNIYTAGFTGSSGRGFLRYAAFPPSYESAPEDDSVVTLLYFLPEGFTTNYAEEQLSFSQFFL
jgi:hypothetical protein